MKNLSQKALPVLLCLASDIMYFGKAKIFPSHARIIKELGKKLSIRLTPRSLMRWLAVMESHGVITRTKRHRYSAQNGWEFRSSLYGITVVGWALLANSNVYSWAQIHRLWDRIKKTFRKPGKTRKVSRPSGPLTSVGDILGGLRYNTS